MHTLLEELGKIGIVPVIKIDDAQKAVPLAKALASGGIPCIEITFRTAQAEDAIKNIAKAMPEMLVGAGTVLTKEQVDKAIDAGAKFIVSPGFNPNVVSYCTAKGIPIVPGCVNPSDIERALDHGLEAVKFFPAEQAGGIEYIKAIAAPYPQLKFMPTGGINAENLSRYIAFEKTFCCGGSWMAGADLINAGEFEKIEALSREAVFNLLGFSVAHIGVNSGSEEEAKKASVFFNTFFGFPVKDGAGSVFSGTNIEFVKTAAPGSRGHIAIGTNSLTRAIARLERGGITFDHDNAKKDATGAVIAVYLQTEILGFAVHLLRKSTASH
ncbi:MAG: bifunctional 4-hydroxy-2-oxoglutarate aldolase/2-dehydro-3-deoxy-phosphogluconate aldolase [Treponema sp.]|jgi:2-dehydro-3-deoxyphosphogluconate aldolase/(4S)-4-hydroxy-2-oxoglutarate aldolase|nr:bifunctional 4-hydroxy-2-oxoglutarate aldolase/2-dehydro-3-deoxy-phosphogluconate aldolase [Treponema sp.]